jgi:hypothetical protein
MISPKALTMEDKGKGFVCKRNVEEIGGAERRR